MPCLALWRYRLSAVLVVAFRLRRSSGLSTRTGLALRKRYGYDSAMRRRNLKLVLILVMADTLAAGILVNVLVRTVL